MRLVDLFVDSPDPRKHWLADFAEIVERLHPGQRVGLAPYGLAARLFHEVVQRRWGDLVKVHLYDDFAPVDRPDILPVASLGQAGDGSRALHPNLDTVFIVSANHSRALVEAFRKAGVPHERIAALDEILRRRPPSVSIEIAGQVLLAAADPVNVEVLRNFVGAQPLLVLFGPAFSDLPDKADILRGAYDARVLWVKPDAAEHEGPRFHPEMEIMTTSARDLFGYLRERSRRDDVLVLTLHNNGQYAAAAMIRATFPDLRLISYVYDWLNLFCPRDHIDLFMRFSGHDARVAEGEYRALDAMLAGEICDGIIHKDGGEDFDLLAGYSRPRLFFPPWPRQRLIHPTSSPRHASVDGRPRIVFLGAILSPRHHPVELFGHGILFDVLERVAARGFDIDLYLWRTGQDICDEYASHFFEHPAVRVLNGAPLAELVPRIAGRYHWGWLISDQPPGIPDSHTRQTLASKLFTYLAMGMPIICTAGEMAMADFIRARGIGVIIDRAAIDRLDEVLAEVDYNALLANLARAQSECPLERKQGDLVRFVETVMQGAWRPRTYQPLG